jgi:hypothetical protein
MESNGPDDDAEIAANAAKVVLLRYGPHLHRDRNFEVFQLSRLGPRALEHEAFHSGIDYSEDPLISIGFIRQQRKVGVAVARLLFHVRHGAFAEAVSAIEAPVEEAVAELLTRRVVAPLNFAPKHQEMLDLIDGWLEEQSLVFDALLAAYFTGEGAEAVAALFAGEPED